MASPAAFPINSSDDAIAGDSSGGSNEWKSNQTDPGYDDVGIRGNSMIMFVLRDIQEAKN
ncbi:MAG TPA: hypothetical protein VNI77_03345 [Nitrososphaera sp.]|nr:hypothetical protein [Nitrososphaera sp.]